jgi:pimeloyl-ACP methyl ester carboxylesterase
MAERTPLVLLPGLLCDRALWEAQIRALSDIAAPVVPDLTRSDTIPGLADGVLAEAPPFFALAGLSMGGYVAFEIMRQAPDRVLRLALLDTSARPDSEERKQARADLIDLAQLGDFKGVTPRLLSRWVHPDHARDPVIAETVMSMTERVGREAYVRQQTAIINRSDSRPGLSRISCPTLVLCGQDDQATPPKLHREMAADIPNARLVIVERCGHLPPLERPEIVNRELRHWLTAE